MKLLAILCVVPLVLPAQETRKIDKICDAGDVASFGLTCSEDEPCPVYLELSAIQDSGTTLAMAGNLHTVNTTIFGVLLVSRDQGRTWTDRRIRSSELDQIQFVDGEHGWVSGVTLDPLPKNPFFLATQDGGQSWKAAEVFEDARLGIITQFRFESVTDGRMIVDESQGRNKRFERFETDSGGAKWESREVADHELRLTAAEEHASSNWRLRLDGDVYRVESRAAGDWDTVTRFAVQTGVCK